MKIRFGFTLVELLIVIAIITMLAGMVTVGGKRAREMAYTNKVKADMATLEIAIAAYHTDVGHFPRMGSWPCNILKAHLQDGEMPGGGPLKMPFPDDGVDITGWNGPYMHFDEEDLVGTPPKSFADPWGTEYFYDLPGKAGKSGSTYYDLWSAGPDRESDDARPETLVDNINNW